MHEKESYTVVHSSSSNANIDIINIKQQSREVGGKRIIIKFENDSLSIVIVIVFETNRKRDEK